MQGLEPVERVESFPGREHIGVERRDGLLERARRGFDHGRWCSKQVDLRLALDALRLQRFQRGTGLAHQRRRHAGQASHLHAITAACRLGPIDAIHTRIGAADDLANAQSTFMLEMTEAAAILHHATEHSLVLMDEIGRGTSTFDGLALAGAIAGHLHERCRAFTLFATHYFELTEFPAKHARALNVHVSAAESGDQIVFLHEIQPGPASRSYGVQVARLAGMPSSLVRQARATLEALEAQRVQSQAQIDLFAAAPPVIEAAPSALEMAIASLNPDMLAPRDALDALYRLKALQGKPS